MVSVGLFGVGLAGVGAGLVPLHFTKFVACVKPLHRGVALLSVATATHDTPFTRFSEPVTVTLCLALKPFGHVCTTVVVAAVANTLIPADLAQYSPGTSAGCDGCDGCGDGCFGVCCGAGLVGVVGLGCGLAGVCGCGLGLGGVGVGGLTGCFGGVFGGVGLTAGGLGVGGFGVCGFGAGGLTAGGFGFGVGGLGVGAFGG